MPAHIHPARFWFAYWLDMSWSIVSPGSMSRHESTRCPPCTESPFAPSGRYPSGGGLSRHLERHYPSLIAHTGSCARPTPSHSLRPRPRSWVLAGCCQPLLGIGPSRRYLRKSFPRCLDPYPGGTLWCTRPFLPIEQRPSPHNYWVGSHTNRRATSLRGFISGLQSFRHVQAPRFAHHPGRSYRSLLARLGSRGFYIRAPHGSLPYRAPDMLVARIGQLTTGDFHPIRLAALSAAPDS